MSGRGGVVARAVRVFRVTRRGVRVRVRVLADVAEVDRAYRAGKPRRERKQVWGYMYAGRSVMHIVLPLAGWTPGLVAHEVTHVADRYGLRAGDDDEPMATIVGELTDSICARLARLGGGCV